MELNRIEVVRLAAKLGLELPATQRNEFLSLAQTIGETLDSTLSSFVTDFDALVLRHAAVGPGRSMPQDPYNAVVTWCDVSEPKAGLLEGKSIGVKDSIAVAGVPTNLGLSHFNYTPSTSAVVVERILAEGGAIVAKLNMDALAWSGGADTSAFGNIANPVDPDFSAGGSSGGSAAALYLDGIDVTLGTDQGGSVRVPASWCGVLGLKPTYGRVPYAGIVGMEGSIDHVGPLSRNVEDLALVLSAIADLAVLPGDTPTRPSADRVLSNLSSVSTSLEGLRIGAVSEALVTPPDAPEGADATIAATHEVFELMRKLGATVEEVSLPDHENAPAYLFVMLMENFASTLSSPSNGYGHRNPQDWRLDAALSAAVGSGRALPPTAIISAIMGQALREKFGGAAYSWVRDRARALTAEIDRALKDFDYLALPTATHAAHKFDDTLAIGDKVLRGWDMFTNTPSTDISGHPAISLPLSKAGQLPVGVMFVTKKDQDWSLVRLAQILEQQIGWYPSIETRS